MGHDATSKAAAADLGNDIANCGAGDEKEDHGRIAKFERGRVAVCDLRGTSVDLGSNDLFGASHEPGIGFNT